MISNCYIVICWFLQKYTYICWIHTDAMNNRLRKTSLSKYLPLTLFVRVRKGYSRFACERELETEQKLQYFDPKLMAVNVVSFSFSRAAQSETLGPLCWVMASLIASYQQLLWTPIQSGLPRAPSAWCGFPYHSSSHSLSNSTATATGTRTQLPDFCLDRAI